MKRIFTVALSILILAGLTSCFGDSEIKKKKDQLEEASKAMQDAVDAIKEQQESGEVVEPVNFREFEREFPDRVKGYERTDFGGETTGSMGFSISTAKAKYVKGDDNLVEVQVVDAGGVGAALMGIAAWSMVSIDKEDSNSLERTGKWKGFKTYEKWDKRGNISEIALIVADRLVFTASARDMSLDDLKDFIDDFDPGDLEDVL